MVQARACGSCEIVLGSAVDMNIILAFILLLWSLSAACCVCTVAEIVTVDVAIGLTDVAVVYFLFMDVLTLQYSRRQRQVQSVL